MINNGVLPLYGDYAQKNYVRAFWYEVREMIWNVC